VDATFREEKNRWLFLEAAVRWGVSGGMLLCQAEPETVRRRLEQRQYDASDADWSVYLQAAESWEKAGALTLRVLHPISMDGCADQALFQAREAINQLGF
jgi:predicted kinase